MTTKFRHLTTKEIILLLFLFISVLAVMAALYTGRDDTKNLSAQPSDIKESVSKPYDDVSTPPADDEDAADEKPVQTQQKTQPASSCNEAEASKLRQISQEKKDENSEQGNQWLADLKKRYDAGEITEEEYKQQYSSLNFTTNKHNNDIAQRLNEQLIALGC